MLTLSVRLGTMPLCRYFSLQLRHLLHQLIMSVVLQKQLPVLDSFSSCKPSIDVNFLRTATWTAMRNVLSTAGWS